MRNVPYSLGLLNTWLPADEVWGRYQLFGGWYHFVRGSISLGKSFEVKSLYHFHKYLSCSLALPSLPLPPPFFPLSCVYVSLPFSLSHSLLPLFPTWLRHEDVSSQIPAPATMPAAYCLTAIMILIFRTGTISQHNNSLYISCLGHTVFYHSQRKVTHLPTSYLLHHLLRKNFFIT